MKRRQAAEMEGKYSIERFREGGGGAGIETGRPLRIGLPSPPRAGRGGFE
jgi:hypothetical protein